MAIYLKLGDKIQSDATEVHHKGADGWIPCETFAAGTMRPMFVETGGGSEREASRAEFNDISLRMKMHKGSPKVFMASLMGDAFTAQIHITRAGDATGSQNYLEVTLENCYVSGYSVDCGGDFPEESVTLNFTKNQLVYTPNKADGKPGAKQPTGFDLAAGKKL